MKLYNDGLPFTVYEVVGDRGKVVGTFSDRSDAVVAGTGKGEWGGPASIYDKVMIQSPDGIFYELGPQVSLEKFQTIVPKGYTQLVKKALDKLSEDEKRSLRHFLAS